MRKRIAKYPIPNSKIQIQFLLPQIPVAPGTYTFKETYAPDGYALNEAEMRFTVDADGNVTGDTTIRDDYTRFSLRKVDESGKPLAGVMFGLKKADGMLMMTAKTDAKGMATFEKVPFGTYMLVETRALPGYLKADTEIRLTVDGTFVNPKEPIATVINERQKIRGLKVDTAGQALTDRPAKCPLVASEYCQTGLFNQRLYQALPGYSDYDPKRQNHLRGNQGRPPEK